MKKLPKELEVPFLELVAVKGDAKQSRADYLKWLRYYLDYCAKYGHPPRERDSLALFLQKAPSMYNTACTFARITSRSFDLMMPAL